MPPVAHTVDLIRHAHSKMNGMMTNPDVVPFIGGRQNDVDLDTLGESQAIAFGESCLEDGIIPSRIACSPALRTRRKHELSAKAMGLTIVADIDDRLQELEQGEWTNQPRTLYDDPVNRAEMDRLVGAFAAPGGESMNMVADRMMDYLGSLAVILDAAEEAENVQVHTHGVAIRTTLGRLLGWTHEQTYRTAIDNVSRTRLVRQSGIWHVNVASINQPTIRQVSPTQAEPLRSIPS